MPPTSRAAAIAAFTAALAGPELTRGFSEAAPAASELLQQFLSKLHAVPELSVEPEASKRIVVIEGLDGTGKSTVWESLSAMPACRAALRTPPDEYVSLRKIVDSCPEDTRRTFYFAANYVAADVALRLAAGIPPREPGFILFDRFYFSTLAYSLAHHHTHETLPTAGDPVYDWPSDLARPSKIVLLRVSEAARLARMAGRSANVAVTEEEERMRKSADFRDLIAEAYARCGGVEAVSADGEREAVLASVLHALGFGPAPGSA